MGVQILDMRRRNPLILLLAWALLPASNASGAEEPLPLYPEEADGESALWVDVGGVGQWVTDRAPVGDFAPLVGGLGFSHRVGVARLAWRAQLLSSWEQERPLWFLYVDLLSIERVYDLGAWRPYWRVALGFGLDLEGTSVGLGSDGYFNANSGADAGVALALGGGTDVFLTEALFLKVDVTMRVHGGAGDTGAPAVATLGLGHLL